MHTRVRFLAAWLILIGAVWTMHPICAEDAPLKAGDRVVTTEQTSVQATQGVVATLEAGVTLTIADVKQGWVGVVGEQNGKKIAGWVRPKALSLALSDTAAEAFERGYILHTRRRYEKALAEYSEAIRLDPNYARAYNNRGLVYQTQGDLKRAIADFGEALRLDPKLDEAYLNRGVAYATQRDYDKAIADFSEAIKLDPKSVQGYRFRAAAYEAKGFKSKANSDLAEAAKAYRPKYDTIAHKAVKIELEVKTKDFVPNYEMLDSIIDEAKAQITPQKSYTEEDAKKILASIDAILLRRRFIALEQGLMCDALLPRKLTPRIVKGIDPKLLRQTLQSGDTIFFSHSLVNSLLYAAMGEALGLPLRVVSAPGHAFVRWCFGGSACVNWETTTGTVKTDAEYETWKHVSKSSAKNGVYLVALSSDETLSRVHANLGLVWSGMWYGLENDAWRDAKNDKKKEEVARLNRAIGCLNKAIELNPKSCEAYLRRGMCWGGLGDQQKAVADDTQAIQLDPELAAAYFARGIAWSAHNEEGKVIDDFSKSIELDPKSASSYFYRGVSRARGKELDKAMDDVNKAIELEPKLGGAYEVRGKLWEIQGNSERAKEDLLKAKTLGSRR